MTHSEMITVIQAAADGKKIQAREHGCVKWIDTPSPGFNFTHYEYRIAPRDLGARLWFWRPGPECAIHILGSDGCLIGTLLLGVGHNISRPTTGQISPDGVNWEPL